MKLIKAKFKSTCAETGKAIPKGNNLYYDYAERKCYAIESVTAAKEATGLPNFMRVANDYGIDTAQENAFFDNFCQQNNI